MAAACRGLAIVVPLLLLAAGCHRPLYTCIQGDIQMSTYIDNTASRVRQTALRSSGDPSSPYKIALIDVDGLLLNRNLTGANSFGDNPVGLFHEKLHAAAGDPCVRAVVLRINSPGGSVAASDLMRRDLEVFQQRTGLPVVACLMDLGAGGAYYLATAADVIVAHPTSVTGGIGVIINLYSLRYEMVAQNPPGVRAETITSGENINTGTQFGVHTDEQKASLQQLADQFHARFIRAVNRARPGHDPGAAEDFDGRIFTATQALARGLIDEIGYLDDAIGMARRLGGVDDTARVVMFRRTNDRAFTQYEITPNTPLSEVAHPSGLSVPGEDRAKLPTFLYLWQPEPLLEKIGPM